jgi:hypothetical protein
MADSKGYRVITYDGLKYFGYDDKGKRVEKTLSWRDLAGMDDQTRSQFYKSAGMTTDEGNQLNALLAKNNNITWVPTRPSWEDWPFGSGVHGGRRWGDPGYAQLSDQLLAQTAGHGAQAQQQQEIAGLKPPDPSAAAGAAAKPQVPAGIAVSPQSMQNWTYNYAVPLMNAYNSQVQGDMKTLQGGINAITGATAGPGVQNFAEPNLQLLGDLRSQAGQAALVNQMLGPTLQALGSIATQGFQQQMVKQAAGAGEATFQQYLNQSPAAQQIMQQAGVGNAALQSMLPALLGGSTQPIQGVNPPTG